MTLYVYDKLVRLDCTVVKKGKHIQDLSNVVCHIKPDMFS